MARRYEATRQAGQKTDGETLKNPRIHEAAKMRHVTALCCHKHRPGLNEIHIEKQIRDLLTAEGWKCLPVIAEITGRQRAADNDELDLVAIAPWESGRRPMLIEVKRGDRDLTVGQLRVISESWDRYLLSVMICDNVDLLREWLKGIR
jgi:hypothetical protein